MYNLFVQLRDLSAARGIHGRGSNVLQHGSRRCQTQGVHGNTAGEHVWASPWFLHRLENKNQLFPHQGCMQDEGADGSCRMMIQGRVQPPIYNTVFSTDFDLWFFFFLLLLEASF